MGSDVALAVDIGGTKVAAGLVDDRGRILEQHRVESPAHASAEEMFGAVTGLIDRLETDRATACGVGCGGPMTLGGTTVSPLNITAWRGFPLRSALERHLGETHASGLPVRVDNDAKALALAEGWQGAARGRENFAAMVVSTGVGAGIVVDGRLVDGHDGNAGHIGHIVVEPGGRPCVCGAEGCLEAEISGTAIAAVTGAPAEEADAAMRHRAGRLVGEAAAQVAALLDVDLFLVGGSVALGFGPDFFDAAQAALHRRAKIAHAQGATIAPVGLGPDAPLIGAAALGFVAAGRPILAGESAP